MPPLQGMIPRSDLLTLPYRPKGYIAGRVLPMQKVYVDTATAQACQSGFGSATTGRLPGGTITAANQVAADYSFLVTEDLSRKKIDKNQIPKFGGVAKYEANLAIQGFREVSDKQEVKIVNAFIAAGAAIDVSSDIFSAVNDYVNDLGGFGAVAISGGAKAFNRVRSNATVKERMIASGVAPANMDPRSISGAQLAAIFQADEVIEARGVGGLIWPSDEIFIQVMIDPDLDPAAIPQLGRMISYVFGEDAGGDQLMTCEQGYDISCRSEVFDFLAMTQAKIFNTAFIARLRLVATSPTPTPTPTPSPTPTP